MPENDEDRLSLVKAIHQLNFYLHTLGVPFTAIDLYKRANTKRESNLEEVWLQDVSQIPEAVKALDEPFTTVTIVETLMRTGYSSVVRVLMREIRHQKITYSQAYIMATPRN
ncbi:hypothetical protein D2Q93_00350 [Alicyclobacillaceae bacterium I2511]|nr:hypothetical protein D2Q93_00350 [Alicyclobacillaceae bacterium I2511]